MLMISVVTLTTKLVASQPYSVLHKPQLVVAEKTVGMASLATHIGFQKCIWVQNVQIGSDMLNIICHNKMEINSIREYGNGDNQHDESGMQPNSNEPAAGRGFPHCSSFELLSIVLSTKEGNL